MSRLSATSLQKAKPGDVLYDDVVRGLHARITPKKTTFYLYFRTHDRRERRPKIGDYGVLTLPQAREIARDWLLKNIKGEPVRERTTVQMLTIRDLYEQWQKEHKPRLKPMTARGMECMWKLHILPEIGSERVATIDRRQIVQMIAKVSRETPTQGNRVKALISKALTLAEEWEWRPALSNPCHTIRRSPEKARRRYLSMEELPKLGHVLQAWESYGGWHRKTSRLFRLLIMTGARKNEIAKAKREWLDLDAGMLRLPDSKTGAKLIALPPNAVALIRRMLAEDGPSVWLFPGKIEGKPIHNCENAWRKILQESGIENLRIHDLRHSFASIALSVHGLNLKQIGEMLGHKDKGTSDRYAHLMEDQRAAISTAVGATIEKLMLPAPGAA